MSWLYVVNVKPDIDVFGHELHYHVAVSVSVVLLALASALCYALASASQHAATQTVPAEESLRPRLLLSLVGRPLWLAGNVADAAAFGLLFLAFRRGSLALVQPLLTSSLLFALPIGALLTRHRLTRGDWLGAALVVLGLSAFLVAAAPGPGHPTSSSVDWVWLGVIGTVVIGGLVVLARRFSRRRAAFLGAAAGAVNAGFGALTKETTRAFDAGIVGALQHWEPYVLAGTGVLSILLVQSAFQAGPLDKSLPLLTVIEAIAGIAIGQALFGERIAGHWLARSVELVGLAILCSGILVLGRSPLVLATEEGHSTVPERS